MSSKEQKLLSLITAYLEKSRMMQVATAKDNQPWACTVYFAYDEQLSLYWISKPTRRHSNEVRENEKVAGTIVLPHTPGDDVRGIQCEGVAKELTDQKEMHVAMDCYARRYGMPKERVEDIVSGKDGHIPYCIKPSLFVLFDEVNYPDNSRQEYKM